MGSVRDEEKVWVDGASEVGQAAITDLLNRWKLGDRVAGERAIEELYGRLRRIAQGYARNERPHALLQATAVVNEALVRLLTAQPMAWQSRGQFLGYAARVMREVLVDESRRNQAIKRGGGLQKVSLTDAGESTGPLRVDVLDLDRALDELAEIAPRDAHIVELRYFAGLSIEEAAEVTGVSPKTVVRSWSRARTWLFVRLTAEGEAVGA